MRPGHFWVVQSPSNYRVEAVDKRMSIAGTVFSAGDYIVRIGEVWGGMVVGGLVATLAMGPIITHFGPQMLYAVSLPVLAAIVVPLALNYLGDEKLSEAEATLYALGIRADTGALTYEGTTARDARAYVWCLERGASQQAIAEFGQVRLDSTQRGILAVALRDVKRSEVRVVSRAVSLRAASPRRARGGRGGRGRRS